MRHTWLCLSVLAALLLTSTAYAAAPVIERVDLTQLWHRFSQGVIWHNSAVTVLVRDADGAADIKEIAIGGYSYEQGITGAPEWTETAADQVRLTVPWGNAIVGPCAVTATDAAAQTDGLTFDALVFPEPGPTVVTPDTNYPVLSDPHVIFSWTGLPSGARGTLTVRRLAGDDVWSCDHTGSAGSAPYDSDGAALQPLRPGFTYGWSLVAEAMLDDGATDPRVHMSLRETLEGQFVIRSATPTIQMVGLTRRSEAFLGQPVHYGEWVGMQVTDTDGANDIVSVTLTFADGSERTLTPTDHGIGYWHVDDAYTVTAGSDRDFPMALTAPVPPAAHTVTAADSAGNTDTLVATATREQVALQLLAPASVTDDLTPLFRWDAGITGATAHLRVLQGATQSVLDVDDLTGTEFEFHAPYDWQQQELDPGLTYLWALDTYAGLPTGDSRVTEGFDGFAQSIFTEYQPWPALPEIDGKLAFATRLPSGGGSWSDTALIQQYDPDPWVRRWLGPLNADFPDWSLDGSKLVFSSNNKLWIDHCDGAAPTSVVEDGSDPRWSADGTKMVFARRTGWTTSDIWIVNADGSDAHAIVANDATKRYPAWSPDGQWIAYGSQSSTDPSTDGVWLVHPDGTEPHHLLPSGVQGYPDYAVTYLGQPGWAPDAGRLVVTFSASSSDADAPGLRGIGVAGRDGGLLKPVFLTPTGVVCCAEPKLPVWSGDGTKAAFSSAHHLPINPAWEGGAFESGVELWMINADGSGEPTRLTHNSGFDGTTSWWASPLFPDVPKGHWAYCAVSTGVQAGLVEGFPGGNYKPLLPVTRDQMAVYIARGLARGDASIPDPTVATPTFADVDTSHWAYRHIEYCAANGIVEGYWNGYRPDQVVTRDQMAVYVSRATADPIGEAGLEGYTGPATPSFADVGADHWAYRYIEYAKEHGIVQGYWDGYRPNQPVTRDQMSMYIARAFRLPM